MIDLELAGNPTAAERWAYETLVDLARLLPAMPGRQTLRARLVEEGHTFDGTQGEVRVHRGLLRQVIALAGAGIEQRSTRRDHHGRVPALENPLVQGDATRTVPVQALAQRFRQAAIAAAGGKPLFTIAPWPDRKRWAAAITHDLDVVAGWPLFAGLRWLELLRKGEVRRAASAIGSALGASLSAPVTAAVDRIIELEQRSGVRATWFVLAGVPSLESWRLGDVTYRLDAPPARRLLDRMTAAQHEIGLHGSFATAASGDRMAAERSFVEQVTGRAPAGVRQHFLRMTPPDTVRLAARAGFTYDSTYGFADRTGFRLGVADTVGLWDEAAGAAVGLTEAPLVWMDRALSKYQGEENPARWVDDALELAAVCREAEGLWTGLWHPNVVPALGFPGALDAFERLLVSLAEEAPYIAPLQEIVTWRTARKGLRGRLHPDGQVELTSPVGGGWTVELRPQTGSSVTMPWPATAHG